MVPDPAAIARLRRLGGDKLLAGMIDAFLTSATQRMESAHQAHAAADRDQLARAMHALKSSAANLGAGELRDLATELETAAPAEDWDRLAALLRDADNAMQRTTAALRSLRGEIEP